MSSKERNNNHHNTSELTSTELSDRLLLHSSFEELKVILSSFSN
jgi:hypothetical protein